MWFILKQMGITVPSLATVKKFQLPDMKEPVWVFVLNKCLLHVVKSDPSEKTHIDRSTQPALQQTTIRGHPATTKHVVDN